MFNEEISETPSTEEEIREVLRRERKPRTLSERRIQYLVGRGFLYCGTCAEGKHLVTCNQVVMRIGANGEAVPYQKEIEEEEKGKIKELRVNLRGCFEKAIQALNEAEEYLKEEESNVMLIHHETAISRLRGMLHQLSIKQNFASLTVEKRLFKIQIAYVNTELKHHYTRLGKAPTFISVQDEWFATKVKRVRKPKEPKVTLSAADEAALD